MMKKGLLKMVTLCTVISMLLPAMCVFAADDNTVTLTPAADSFTGGSSGVYDKAQGQNDLLLMQSADKNGTLAESTYYNQSLVYMNFELPDYIAEGKRIVSAKLKMYGGGYKYNSDGVTGRVNLTVPRIQFFKLPEAYENWVESTMNRSSDSMYPFGTWGEDAWKDSGDNRSTHGTKYPLVNVDESAVAVEKGYPRPNTVLNGPFTFPEGDHKLFTFDITDMIRSYSVENNQLISFCMMPFSVPAYNWVGFTSKEGDGKTGYENCVLGNGPELELILEDVEALATTDGPSGDVNYKDDITVTFNNMLDTETVSKDSVKLYCDGEPVNDYTVAADANTVTVSGEKTPYSDYTVECTTVIKDLYNQSMNKPRFYEFQTTMGQTTKSWKHNYNADTAELQLHSAVLSSYTNQLDSPRVDPENERYTGQAYLANASTGNSASQSAVFSELDLTKILATIDDPSLINNITLNMMAVGDIDWSLRAIPNDIVFDVTTVTYNKMTELLGAERPATLLPSLEEIGVVKDNIPTDSSPWPYVAIDLTSYAKQRIAEGAADGRYLVRFAIESHATEPVLIRTERTWTSSLPYLEITMDEKAVAAVRSSNPANKADNFPIGDSIEVVMSADIQVDDVTASNVILQKADGSGEVVDAEIAYNPYTRTITVNPEADLEPITPYKLTVQNLQTTDGVGMARAKVISFITGSVIDYTPLESISGSLTNGSTISVSTTLTNNSGDTADSYVLILGLYEDTGMVDVAIEGANITIAGNGGTKELNASIQIPATGGPYTAKAFLWNSLGQQRPLTDFIELK